MSDTIKHEYMPNQWTPNWELIAQTPCGEDIQAMTAHKGILYVATANRIYWLDEEAKTLIEVESSPLPVIDPSMLEVGK